MGFSLSRDGRLSRSEAGPLLEGVGVARSVDRDLQGGAVDLTEIVGRQIDRSRAEVLFEALQLASARDRNDPGLLGEEPGERDLRMRRVLLFCDPAKQIDQRLVRLPSLRREPRNDVAEVGTVERRALVDLPRQEALAQRAERNEPDAEPLEGALGALLDVLGPAADDLLPTGVERDPELGGDHHFPAEGSKGFADELFVREWPVDLGGVEEGDADVDRFPEESDHLLVVSSGTVAVTHPHAPESESRDFEPARPQFALLHHFSSTLEPRSARGARLEFLGIADAA